MNNPYTPQINFSLPQWRISLIFSIIIHILVVSLIFLAPSANKKQEKSLITRLITPDEWSKEFPKVKPPVIPPRVKPSDIPPNELFGTHRASRTPKHVAPRNEGPRKESRSTPAPLPLQPRTKVPETNVAPNAIDKGTANQVAGVREKPTVKGTEPESTTPSPKARSIPAPLPSLREKLFDSEVVGKIARRDETRHDNGVTFDTTELMYESYMMKLKDRIESIWHYPSEEARRGIHGDVYITFTIHKDGRLGDIELERSSGFPGLDRAAIQALKEGNPYWPLPDDWGRDSLVVPGHFIYSIYGTYVR
jgi:protein TonB